MSWSRGSLIAALLALPVSNALADTVVVNTTADDASTSTCSLRDAVAYLNIPAATRPASHANGCARQGDASDSNVITLPYRAAPYVVSGAAIQPDVSMSIRGEASADLEPRNPFVWVKGSQALKIDGPSLTEDLGTTDASFQMNQESDTGVSNTDRHTTVRLPVFSGTAAPSETVCLFAKKSTDPVTSYVPIAAGFSSAAGVWVLPSSATLALGVNDIALVEDPVSNNCGELDTDVDTIDKVIKVSVYAPTSIAISSVDFVGCQANAAKLPSYMTAAGVVPGTCTGTEGGIFYLNEAMNLELVSVRGGSASQGGIAYIAEEGGFSALTSAFIGGDAAEGSAFYIVRGGALQLARVLVAEGKRATEAIKFAAGVPSGSIIPSLIEQTTLHGNDGYALLVQDRIRLNGLTIINNDAGSINFGISDLTDKALQVLVFNSIVSGGCTTVTWPATAADAPRFNLADPSCGFPGTQNTPNDGDLLAVPGADKSCSNDASGVLCPKDENADGVVDYFVPRFLPGLVQGSGSYSEIINKGSFADAISACVSSDQRASDHAQAGRCDIGAIELQYLSGTFSTGDFLVSGRLQQTFQSVLFEESDEEIYLPADPTICPVVMPTAPLTAPAGADACPWLSRSPTKGTVRLTSDRRGYVYVASSNYHGFDTFQIEVTTTASRLNDYSHATSRTRGISIRANNEPASGIKSDSTLDGGVMDWSVLLGFALLAARRRLRKEARLS